MTVRRVRRPCAECPCRSDVPPGKFGPERFEALRATAGAPGKEAVLGAPWFACHKSPEGEGEERACAGWLVLCGADHLGVRLALARGDLPLEALETGPGWPPLYESYAEMELANKGRGVPIATKDSTLGSPTAKAIANAPQSPRKRRPRKL